MLRRTIPTTGEHYALLVFDADGLERSAGGAEKPTSHTLLTEVASTPVTDMFVFAHGWQGDVPAAIDQYDRWFAALGSLTQDRALMGKHRPGFRPAYVGLHWPSKPWGDEELEFGSFSVAQVRPAASSLEVLLHAYVERLGDRPGLSDILRTILREKDSHPEMTGVPDFIVRPYRLLDDLLPELTAQGVGAPPGNDRERFDPVDVIEALDAEASFGGSNFGGLLAPLRQLSFWRMKHLARSIGEGGMHTFLARLRALSRPYGVRIHLMGHSFGCIVASAMASGPVGSRPAEPLVDSLVLLQGAMSLWSYCPDIPGSPGQAGYFHDLVAKGLVRGPIVTTRSIHDTAVGRFYPLGAGLADQIAYRAQTFPLYGALGSFGAQGIGSLVVDRSMRQSSESYVFDQRRIYNLEASEFIRIGTGASGAHSDIDGAEVAHVIWQAALSAVD